MNVVRLPVSMFQWVRDGNNPDAGTLYVCVEASDGNVRPFRATVYKGALLVVRTGACKTPGQAAGAANKLWRSLAPLGEV